MLLSDIRKNMFQRVLFFCIFILIAFFNKGYSKTVFDMNAECLQAQALIYDLKFEEAEIILDSETKLNSENIAVPWLSESIIFLRLIITEDKAAYKQSVKKWSQLISQTQKSNFNNAWYRYILSDMYLHRGLIKLKFHENISAGGDIQAAYKYLKDNRKMFSSFLPDNMNYGLLSCAFSTVPLKYQWLSKLIGFQGDMNTGLTEIETYLNSNQSAKEHVFLKRTAAYIYALVSHHLDKNTSEAWKVIEPYSRQYKQHIIENYMRATIAGYNGMNDEMIEVLKNKPKYSSTYSFYYLDFLLGLAKMRRLDSDADIYFKIFVVKYKGNNYIKSAYRYLSWICQYKGDDIAAKTYYTLCKTKGIAEIEEDKHAEQEALENLPWPKELIKARLLFDGKYFKESSDLLKKMNETELSHIRFQLEFIYRNAKLLHEKNDYTPAIIKYKEVIEKGQSQSYYYAANSALQIALIYELQNNKSMAKTYFNKAKKDFPLNKEYASSIEHKAKAGLKRIGK